MARQVLIGGFATSTPVIVNETSTRSGVEYFTYVAESSARDVFLSGAGALTLAAKLFSPRAQGATALAGAGSLDTVSKVLTGTAGASGATAPTIATVKITPTRQAGAATGYPLMSALVVDESHTATGSKRQAYSDFLLINTSDVLPVDATGASASLAAGALGKTVAPILSGAQASTGVAPVTFYPTLVGVQGTSGVGISVPVVMKLLAGISATSAAGTLRDTDTKNLTGAQVATNGGQPPIVVNLAGTGAAASAGTLRVAVAKQVSAAATTGAGTPRGAVSAFQILGVGVATSVASNIQNVGGRATTASGATGAGTLRDAAARAPTGAQVGAAAAGNVQNVTAIVQGDEVHTSVGVPSVEVRETSAGVSAVSAAGAADKTDGASLSGGRVFAEAGNSVDAVSAQASASVSAAAATLSDAVAAQASGVQATTQAGTTSDAVAATAPGVETTATAANLADTVATLAPGTGSVATAGAAHDDVGANAPGATAAASAEILLTDIQFATAPGTVVSTGAAVLPGVAPSLLGAQVVAGAERIRDWDHGLVGVEVAALATSSSQVIPTTTGAQANTAAGAAERVVALTGAQADAVAQGTPQLRVTHPGTILSRVRVRIGEPAAEVSARPKKNRPVRARTRG